LSGAASGLRPPLRRVTREHGGGRPSVFRRRPSWWKPTKAVVKAEAVVKREATRKAHKPNAPPAPAPVPPPVTPPKA
jgi:hypothetical protein